MINNKKHMHILDSHVAFLIFDVCSLNMYMIDNYRLIESQDMRIDRMCMRIYIKEQRVRNHDKSMKHCFHRS
jgi:hypothetical protein